MPESWIEELREAQVRAEAGDEQMIEEDWPAMRSWNRHPDRPMSYGDVEGMRFMRLSRRDAVFSRHAARIVAALIAATSAAPGEEQGA